MFLIMIQSQLVTSQNRYCPEAVLSVESVKSCPTSKTEWENASRRKSCSGIAPKQNCVAVEKFEYHCVINGLRNKLIEVCAPSRVIFGHCVEFNVRGGVIQDQMSAPCKNTFPVCNNIYLSSDAYKYPDCYKLVSITKPESTVETKLPETVPIVAVLLSVLICASIFAVVIWQTRKRRQSAHNKIVEDKENKETMLNDYYSQQDEVILKYIPSN